MQPPELAIPVRDLDAAGKHYVFTLRAPWIRGALAGQEAVPAGPDGELDVRVSRSGNDVVVHGALRAELTMPCARCLEPASFRVDHPVSVLMVPRRALREALHSGGSEREVSEEEADTLPYDGETVVLDELVRDELVLETPMIPLCSEDCPGITALPQDRKQSKNKSETSERESGGIDPRLAPLLRFKAQKE